MKLLFGLFCLCFCVVACRSGLPRDAEGREDFEAFYAKFYRDSAFQLERIDFDALNVQDGFFEERYRADNWAVLRLPKEAEARDYRAEINRKSEDLMQVILVYDNTLYLETHFNLNIRKEWEMTRYTGMRPFVQVPSTPGGEAYRAAKDSLARQADSLGIEIRQE